MKGRLVGLLLIGVLCAGMSGRSEVQAAEVLGASPPATGDATQMMDDIIVTATRLATPYEEVGSSVTVITAKEIEESHQPLVLDLLRQVPGLDVARTGGPGGAVSVYLRGAQAGQTLVLIDGVEVNDPSAADRAYDFSDLTTDDIERIEILRGPQGMLYGSDAMGGVIQIFTKRGKGRPTAIASAEAGAFNTYRGGASLKGGAKWGSYALSYAYLDSDGISAADAAYGNKERDGYTNSSFSTAWTLRPTSTLDLDFNARVVNARSDLDQFGGRGGDDPNYTQDAQQLSARGQGKLTLLDGRWIQTLGLSLSEHDRDYHDPTDAEHPQQRSKGSYDGELLKLDWQHNILIRDDNTVVLGLEASREEAKSFYESESSWGLYQSRFPQKTARDYGYYLQDQLEFRDRLFVTVGARVDDHSRFGTRTTYRIAPSYLFPRTGTRLKASYGTGFKAPTLFELYSAYGSPDLDPEESKGWDCGVEQTLFHKALTLDLTYFGTNFDNLIDYDAGTNKYMNISKAKVRGVEFSAVYNPTAAVSLRAAYTYLDTKDEATGKTLVRRPANKVSLGANVRFLTHGRVDLSADYVGPREDRDYSVSPARRVRLGDYTLVNLATSYDVTPRVQVWGRVDNLLDEDYEEVRGYGTPGIGAYLGFKLTL